MYEFQCTTLIISCCIPCLLSVTVIALETQKMWHSMEEKEMKVTLKSTACLTRNNRCSVLGIQPDNFRENYSFVLFQLFP